MPVDMKNLIAETFASMVKQKGIDKITVKALIEACNISRQTFYYHFQDLMAVIEWSLNKASEELLARTRKAETPEKAIEILIASAIENKTLIRRLLDSPKREQIEKIFLRTSKAYLQEIIQSRQEKITVDYAVLEVALSFWSFGLCGILFACAVSKDKVNIERLSSSLCRIFTGEIFDNKK